MASLSRTTLEEEVRARVEDEDVDPDATELDDEDLDPDEDDVDYDPAEDPDTGPPASGDGP